MTRARLVALTVAAVVLLTGCGTTPASNAVVKGKPSTSASKSTSPSAKASLSPAALAAKTEHGRVQNLTNPDWNGFNHQDDDLSFQITPGLINQAHLPKAEAKQYVDAYEHFVTAHYLKPGRSAGAYFVPDSEWAEMSRESTTDYMAFFQRGALASLNKQFRQIDKRDPVDGKAVNHATPSKKDLQNLWNLDGVLWWRGFEAHTTIRVSAPRVYRDSQDPARIWVSALLTNNKGKFFGFKTPSNFFYLGFDKVNGKPLVAVSTVQNTKYKG